MTTYSSGANSSTAHSKTYWRVHKSKTTGIKQKGFFKDENENIIQDLLSKVLSRNKNRLPPYRYQMTGLEAGKHSGIGIGTNAHVPDVGKIG